MLCNMTSIINTYIIILLSCVLHFSNADIMEIYNTKLATSDLLWTKHSSTQDEGWEEVSSFDQDYQNTIRSYQVCQIDEADSNNWIRSPYIPTNGGKGIHVDVEFSIAKCSSNPGEGKNAKCKETFNLFYYEAEGNIASSTFPPWHERPYIKIDTVAANDVNGINKKSFKFGPLSRRGFYIAVQDQGACMSLIALRVYYYYCHETTQNLAVFPKTISDVGGASIVTVTGQCATHGQISEVPEYRCSSNGQWQIPTGGCHCDAGYHSNSLQTECIPCPAGTYKLRSGPGGCIRCPRNSGLPDSSSLSTSEVDRMSMRHNQCPCHPGFARAPQEDIDVSCTRPPSRPLGLNLTAFNATSASLQWSAPLENGGRDDLHYRVECKFSDVAIAIPSWNICPATIVYLAPTDGGRIYGRSVTVTNLTPYTKYRLTVYAQNGASTSLGQSSESSSEISLQTDEAAPSRVSNVRVIDAKQTSITLEWPQPGHSNGVIIGYDVELQLKPKSPRPSALQVAPILKETTERFIKLTGLLKDSEYKVRVRAKTSAGPGLYNSPSTFYTTSSNDPPGQPSTGESNNIVLIVAGAVGGLFIVFVLVIALRYKSTGKLLCLNASRGDKKKSKHPALQNGSAHQDHMLGEPLIVDLPPPGQRIYVDYPNPQAAVAKMCREVNPRDIRIEEVIGAGEFAEVCRGKLFSKNCQLDVAVKRLKRGACVKDQCNFLREASTMIQFKDPNIIELKGVVMKNEPVMIVTEFMQNGSLDRYLRSHAGELSVIQLVSMLKGIASGMRYLSTMKYVHRDLAARNILLSSDLVCKVSDFGLSRTLENDPHATYTTQGGKIAIRWTALECILFRKFTSASDVWSYGIVMWEVMSYGEKPYWDMSNEDVIANIQKGMRLPSPMHCPKSLHDMMVRCWLADVSARPTFVELVQTLDQLLNHPDQLLSDHSGSSTTQRPDAARDIATPNLGRAMDSGEVDSVEKWLEIQRLSTYKEHFRQRGIDNLEKVSNLTLNDLKAIGIDVTLHIAKLENGIRTLKRHLSTCTSTPSSSARTSNASTLPEHEEGLTLTVSPQGGVLV